MLDPIVIPRLLLSMLQKNALVLRVNSDITSTDLLLSLNYREFLVIVSYMKDS